MGGLWLGKGRWAGWGRVEGSCREKGSVCCRWGGGGGRESVAGKISVSFCGGEPAMVYMISSPVLCLACQCVHILSVCVFDTSRLARVSTYKAGRRVFVFPMLLVVLFFFLGLFPSVY